MSTTPLAAALAMTPQRAAEILTWTDEPDLIAEAGQLVPVFTAEEVAAARLHCGWNAPTPTESAAAIALAASCGLNMRG